jgi:hypothetical protein
MFAGSAEQPSDELRDLAEIARELRRTIDPQVAPSEAFHAQLTHRLMRELPSKRRVSFMPQRRATRLAWAAAGITLVMFVAVLLTSQDTSGEQSGTAGGSALSLLNLILLTGVVSAAGVAFWIWYTKFRK